MQQLMGHVKDNDLLESYQSTYNSETALVRVVNDVLNVSDHSDVSLVSISLFGTYLPHWIPLTIRMVFINILGFGARHRLFSIILHPSRSYWKCLVYPYYLFCFPEVHIGVLLRACGHLYHLYADDYIVQCRWFCWRYWVGLNEKWVAEWLQRWRPSWERAGSISD